jgi:hypothetical protein
MGAGYIHAARTMSVHTEHIWPACCTGRNNIKTNRRLMELIACLHYAPPAPLPPPETSHLTRRTN